MVALINLNIRRLVKGDLDMNKNIVMCVILTIVTCGIYGIVWMASINDTATQVAPQEWSMSFLKFFLLSLVTCGIFTYVWYYKMGKAMSTVTSGDNSMLYIILAIFGLGIVNLALIQNDINTIYPE